MPTASERPFHSSGSQTSVNAVEPAVEFVVMTNWTRQNAGRELVLMEDWGVVIEIVAFAGKCVVELR